MPRVSKALQVVLEEAQIRAQQLHLKRRAALYRGLAEVCGHSHKAAEYLQMAKQCEALHKLETKSQFHLSLEGDGE